jgi:hypothetical protein
VRAMPALLRMLRSSSQVMVERVFQSVNAASICWSAWVADHSVTVRRCLNASELFPVIRAKPK